MEMTLNAKMKKKLSKKEMMIENLRWKLKFHEEKAQECRDEIEYLMEGDESMNYNDNIFEIQEPNKIPYKIERITPDGQIYSTRKNLNLDIHQVLKVKHRVVDKEISIEKAKEIATDIGISYDVLQKVAYNLTTGVFDDYIDEWQKRLNKTQTNNLAIN